MAFLIDGKLLFIHPPRCGGEWFSKALTNAGVQQYRIGNKHGHVCSNIEILDVMQDPNIKTMTCIRHPAEWYKSYWELMTRQNLDMNTIEKWNLFEDNSMWHPTWDIDNECFAYDFDGFINKCVDKFPSYLSYLYDDYTRRPAVDTIDYIILTKDLEEKAPLILEECGIALDIEKFLATERYNSFKNDNVKYSVESINKILISEKRCIEKFNFSNNIEDLKDLIK
jgi:hypothetical protein